MFRRIHCDCNTVHNRTRWDREILKIFFSERERETIAAAAVSKSAAEREQLHSKKKEKKTRRIFFYANFPRAGVRQFMYNKRVSN